MTPDTQATTRSWTEPGAFPVAPGVHRVPLPLPTDGLRAVIETRAHLELLAAQGRLAVASSDGVVWYEPPPASSAQA